MFLEVLSVGQNDARVPHFWPNSPEVGIFARVATDAFVRLAKPKPSTRDKASEYRGKPRSGERMQPTAQAVGGEI